MNYNESIEFLKSWFEEAGENKEVLYADWSLKYFNVDFLKKLTAELSRKSIMVRLNIDSLSYADRLALEFLKDLAAWYNVQTEPLHKQP